MSAFDVAAYAKGASKAGLSLHSQSVQAVSEKYVLWRSNSRNAAFLGVRPKAPDVLWVGFPLRPALAYRDGQVRYQVVPISLWDSYGLKVYKLGAGSFSENSRGRWYMNVTVKVKQIENPKSQLIKQSVLGIDLRLKDLMTGSDGFKVEAQNFYRDLEPKLAGAQRAGMKDRSKAIHAKVSNRPKYFLHKASSHIAACHEAVFVIDVNASGLAKTKMAKSVLDSGWSTFRTMLRYKCDHAGVWF